MVLRDGVEQMSMSGKRTVPVIPGLPPDDHRLVYYYVMYPNMLLSPHPDYVLVHTAWALAPNRTRVVCEWLFTQEAMAQRDFDPSDMVEFWDVTNRQDGDSASAPSSARTRAATGQAPTSTPRTACTRSIAGTPTAWPPCSRTRSHVAPLARAGARLPVRSDRPRGRSHRLARRGA